MNLTPSPFVCRQSWFPITWVVCYEKSSGSYPRMVRLKLGLLPLGSASAHYCSPNAHPAMKIGKFTRYGTEKKCLDRRVPEIGPLFPLLQQNKPALKMEAKNWA